MSAQINMFAELTKPFPSDDIEWRVQQSGEKNGKPWAMVIPYITSRAIQNRLDEVFGPLGWKSEEKQVHGGWMCGISVYSKDLKEWVTKWDGADNITMTDDKKQKYDSVKAGISASMKRAAVQWGIGRYLYKMEACFADCFTNRNGKNRGNIKPKNGGQWINFTWNPPVLPEWALPEEERGKQPIQQTQQYQQQEQPQQQQQSNGHNREAYLANRRQQTVEQHQQQGFISETPENAYRKREKQTATQQYFKNVADDVRTQYQNNRQKQNDQAVNQSDVKPPVEPTSDKVIMPNQVKELVLAIQMAGLDNHQFCNMARINQIGELTQNRFTGAMNQLKKEAQRSGAMAH